MTDEHAGLIDFLVGYDYGMGGVWGYVRAESADDICRLYPEVTVFTTPPPFLSEDDLRRFWARPHVRLDDPPSGVLAVAFGERDHD